MVCKVVITKYAQNQLRRYTGYIVRKFKDKQAALSLMDDSRLTKAELLISAESLELCSDPYLYELGYRTISFRKHRYLFIYQIKDDIVYVEAVYHELQDYENIFKNNVLNG